MHDPNCPCSAHDPQGEIARRVAAGIAAKRNQLAHIIGTPAAHQRAEEINTLDRLASRSGWKENV